MTSTEPGALVIDWERWQYITTEHDVKSTDSGGLERGQAILVTEDIALDMTEPQIDDYMDWYESTWAADEDAGNPGMIDESFPLPFAIVNRSSNPCSTILTQWLR